jgi:hypothetical protein
MVPIIIISCFTVSLAVPYMLKCIMKKRCDRNDLHSQHYTSHSHRYSLLQDKKYSLTRTVIGRLYFCGLAKNTKFVRDNINLAVCTRDIVSTMYCKNRKV